MNALQIPTDEYQPRPMRDWSTESGDGQVAVYFRNLEDRLVELIEGADAVFGCVAWLTSERILRTLATKRGCSIIVQKEDFLRLDSNAIGDWRRRMRLLYRNVPGWNRYLFNDGVMVLNMSSGGDPTLDAIRCVGNYNRDKAAAFPRAHHKFVVFCRVEALPLDDCCAWTPDGHEHAELPVPYAVWTGSFNFTHNAGRSLENAVVLREPALVAAYMGEYGQVAALSEPLDWDAEWSAPEWRLGT